MCKLWWFKMLSCARSAMEWAHVNSSWGQMLSNAIYGASRGRYFSKPEGAASSSASHQARYKLHNFLLKVAAGKKKIQETREEMCARRSGGGPFPSSAECSCPSMFNDFNELLLTWVFLRAQAPFELCLLDSSQLLLLWPSETQLPPCPGSETEYVSMQSWVIITNSQQDLSCGEMMEPTEGKGNWLRKIR